MGKHYATCGHEIYQGIALQVEDGHHEGYSYGTYCADCALEYWLQERILNKEFNDFIDKVFDYRARNDMNKSLWRLFRGEALELLKKT